MSEELKTKRSIVRVAGKLKEIVTIHDKTGNIVHKFMNPLMLELYPRDIVQIIIGAMILAIPVGFTEEVWVLGATLPLINVLSLFFLSLIFLSIFVYYNYYRNQMKEHKIEFLKRVSSTYFFSFLVVALFLTIIQKAPWQVDWVLACKRVILVSFPASMSAAVADIIK